MSENVKSEAATLLAAARKAKDALKAQFENQPWYNGVGITKLDDGFSGRLGLSLRAKYCSEEEMAQVLVAVPAVVENHPVKLEFVEFEALQK
jgi:hypothetical protein